MPEDSPLEGLTLSESPIQQRHHKILRKTTMNQGTGKLNCHKRFIPEERDCQHEVCIQALPEELTFYGISRGTRL